MSKLDWFENGQRLVPSEPDFRASKNGGAFPGYERYFSKHAASR